MGEVAGGAAPGPPRSGLVSIIIGAEDEDFENELEANPEDQNSQFQSLEQVKRRPAHLMALLQHVALQFEPGPLLCCLHADMLSSLGPKEAKKAFLDFYHSFLEKTAVLRVPVPPSVAFELDRTRPDLISEDVQRRFIQEVVQSQQAAVTRQLEDFRSKRLMGMTPWEQELSLLEPWIGKDRGNYEARERHVAERLLSHLEEMQHTISTDEEKSAAVVTAISLYMRHLGVRTKSGDKKSGRNFFRKKVMGNRRSDEPPKTKKGLSSILDPARWNRGEPSAPDCRHLKVEVDEKPGPADRKGSLGISSRDRTVGTPGQDNPGVSLHPLSVDSLDSREPGVDTPQEPGDTPPQGPTSLEPLAPPESTEDNGETERCPLRCWEGLGRAGQHRGLGRVLGIAAAVYACLSQSSLLPPDLLLPVSRLPSILPSSPPPSPLFLFTLCFRPSLARFSPLSSASFIPYSHPLPLLSKLCLPRGPAPGVPCPLCALSCCVLGALSPSQLGGRLCPLPVLVLLLQETLGGYGELGWAHPAHL